MTPDDFPMYRLGQLEGTLIGQADHQREQARKSIQSAMPGATGYYESALAYYEAARQTQQAARDIAADIDQRAQQQPQQGGTLHMWPVPDLELIDADDSHLDGWGVELDFPGPESMHLTLKANADGEAILTLITSDWRGERQGLGGVMDARRWAALRALGDRIFAGIPVPINETGDLRDTPTVDH